MNATVTEGQAVTKGQIVAYSFRSDTAFSQFEHLHFEVRVGGLFQANCCNPWQYLPNINNSYTTFAADIQLHPNYNNLNCEAVVNVSIPPNQLTMNRVELHVRNNGMESVRVFDFCEDNLDHTFEELDDPLFEQKLYVSPGQFSSRSHGKGENLTYGFHFLNLTETRNGPASSLMAVVYDVFGNKVETPWMQYRCSGTASTATSTATASLTATSGTELVEQTTLSTSRAVIEEAKAAAVLIGLGIATIASYM